MLPAADRPALLDQGSVEAALSGAGVAVHLGRVRVVATAGSTSSDLMALGASDPDGWPDRSVLVADHQQAGRGRAGRTWTTPPGRALTVSVLLRPSVPTATLGWLPLVAGLAVTQAIDEVAGVRAVLKWPNDVLVPAPDGTGLPGWGPYRKVCGVLGDLAVGSGGTGAGETPSPVVVIGMGINVSQTVEELPVPSAVSLAQVTGAPVGRARLLTALLGRLVALDDRWRTADGDAWACGVADEISAVCSTLGSEVLVDLPGDEVLAGTATRLGPGGALEVTGPDGRSRTVLAGDVRHVRTAGGADR